MNLEECAHVAASFAAFHQEFAPLFGRTEARERSEQYLRGLLVQQPDRRNAENLAESIEGATPRSLQRFLTESPWHDAPVIARLQHITMALLAGAFLLSLQRDWGEKLPQITRPQLTRVLRELLPRHIWTRTELWDWLHTTHDRSERAKQAHAARRRVSQIIAAELPCCT